MNEINEKELEFVIQHYDHNRFNPEKAISKFHASHKGSRIRRWLLAAGATAASVFVAVAAGFTVHHIYTERTMSQAVQSATINTEVDQIPSFVYNATPLEDVLAELSAYYGCTLRTETQGKVLSATFYKNEDMAFVVATIEQALDVKIIAE